MKTKILYCSILLTAMMFTNSCEKEGELPQPEACFSVPSQQVGIFEVFSFMNCSGAADYYVIYTGEEGSQYDFIGDTTIVDRKGNYIYQTSKVTITEGGSVDYYYRQPGTYKAVLVATNVSKWGGETIRDTASILITVE